MKRTCHCWSRKNRRAAAAAARDPVTVMYCEPALAMSSSTPPHFMLYTPLVAFDSIDPVACMTMRERSPSSRPVSLQCARVIATTRVHEQQHDRRVQMCTMHSCSYKRWSLPLRTRSLSRFPYPSTLLRPSLRSLQTRAGRLPSPTHTFSLPTLSAAAGSRRRPTPCSPYWPRCGASRPPAPPAPPSCSRRAVP